MSKNIAAIVVLGICFVVLSGCGEGGGGPDQVDLSLSCGEGHVRQIDGSCLKICPEGQYDVDDVCTDIPNEDADTTDGPPPSTSKPTKVKIKSADVITGCVFQVSRCGGNITASGGSKSYTWKVISGTLPDGMTFKAPAASDKNTSKASIIGSPTKITGSNAIFEIKIGVEDAKDATKHDEVSFSFTVTDKLNLSLYQALPPDSESLRLIDGRSDALELENKILLQAIVVGKSAEYIWGIDAKNVKCYKDADAKNPDECKGDISGKLIQTSTIGKLTIPTSTYIMPAKEEYRGYKFENLVITVANKVGDKKTITISSVVFKPDPCTVPLTVTSTDFDTSKDVKRTAAINSEFLDVTFKVKGGKAPYTWWIAHEGGPDSIAMDLTKEESPADDDSEYTVAATVVPTVSLTWRKLMEKPKLNYLIFVNDSCGDPRRQGIGTITIEVTDGAISSLGSVQELNAKVAGLTPTVNELSLYSGTALMGKQALLDSVGLKEISFATGSPGPIIHINRINVNNATNGSISKFELYTDNWIMKGADAALSEQKPSASTNLIQYMKGYPPTLAGDCKKAHPNIAEDKEEMIACMMAGVADIWYANTDRPRVVRQ